MAPWKNSTLAMLPSLSATLAATLIVAGAAKSALTPGALSDTLGALSAVNISSGLLLLASLEFALRITAVLAALCSARLTTLCPRALGEEIVGDIDVDERGSLARDGERVQHRTPHRLVVPGEGLLRPSGHRHGVDRGTAAACCRQ